MKTIEAQIIITNASKLRREILTDPQLGSLFDSFNCNNSKTFFNFSDIFDSSNEAYLINTFLINFQDINDSFDHNPKIIGLINSELGSRDFREIDYRSQLNQTLFPLRTFVQGELQKVEWHSDSECTDLILIVDITYTRDAFGFPLTRSTVRTWIKNNSESHLDKKFTSKNYTSNPISQIQEGKRRRGNIVDGIQIPIMSLMMETMQNLPWSLTMNQILLMGRDFMDRHSDEFDKFISHSSSDTEELSPTYGQKYVVIAIKNSALTTDLWLKNKPASLGGIISIEDYLVNEFSI